MAVRAVHHLLLAHGEATQAMRALAAGPRLGINLNLDPVSPASTSPDDVEAASRIDGLYNRLFLDPLFRGRYPADVLEALQGIGGLERVEESELKAIPNFGDRSIEEVKESLSSLGLGLRED